MSKPNGNHSRGFAQVLQGGQPAQKQTLLERSIMACMKGEIMNVACIYVQTPKKDPAMGAFMNGIGLSGGGVEQTKKPSGGNANNRQQ